MGFGKVSGTAVNLQGPNQMDGRMTCRPASPSCFPVPSPCQQIHKHCPALRTRRPGGHQGDSGRVGSFPSISATATNTGRDSAKRKTGWGPHEFWAGLVWTNKRAVESTAATCPSVGGGFAHSAVWITYISGADHP